MNGKTSKILRKFVINQNNISLKKLKKEYNQLSHNKRQDFKDKLSKIS